MLVWAESNTVDFNFLKFLLHWRMCLFSLILYNMYIYTQITGFLSKSRTHSTSSWYLSSVLEYMHLSFWRDDDTLVLNGLFVE